MTEIVIAHSILDYAERGLKEHLADIKTMLDAGVEWIHIDVMRDPFIEGKTAFTAEEISLLCNEFGRDAFLDFHLMVSHPEHPEHLLSHIESKVPPSRRERSNISIHREAYRYGPAMNLQIGKDADKYARKEHDLYSPSTQNTDWYKKLKSLDTYLCGSITSDLKRIKEAGFNAGLALEPGTSLKGITDDMKRYMDMLLLMSVRSGEGGQSYDHNVTYKIEQARKADKDLMIQVDGGINSETLQEVLQAGANNLVIGSYITRTDNLAGRIGEIQDTIKRYSE
ncbi:MAG: hypothetical protein KKC05_02860 [Nanoarchaeota archaeon]|nr:hypothetical protein [Nanoarchaeota archaeon]